MVKKNVLRDLIRKLIKFMEVFHTFNDDYVSCVSGGDKKCNTIKFSSSYFSL